MAIRKLEKSTIVDTELKKLSVKVLALNITNGAGLGEIIDSDKFSDLGKLYRITAYTVRFVNNCKNRSKRVGDLTANEINNSEKMWQKEMQKTLTKSERFEKTKKSLGLFQDEDELWRCGGRISNANLPYDTIHPVIIPPDHPVTNLIIRKAHQSVFHNGVKETLAQLRAKHWIVRGRQIVKKVVGKCNICRRLEGLAYGDPKISQLPKGRVEGGQAFNCIGIDFCGPLYLAAEGEGETKSYIALITCATTRMVHLELCSDLGVTSLLACLKRFFARRGTPLNIISDNAKTFKSKVIKQFTAMRGINWNFNLAKAPWWGGMFERMIRSTKRCLRKNA